MSGLPSLVAMEELINSSSNEGKTTESWDPKVEMNVTLVQCCAHLSKSFSSQYITDTLCVCRMMDKPKSGQISA